MLVEKIDIFLNLVIVYSIIITEKFICGILVLLQLLLDKKFISLTHLLEYFHEVTLSLWSAQKNELAALWIKCHNFSKPLLVYWIYLCVFLISFFVILILNRLYYRLTFTDERFYILGGFDLELCWRVHHDFEISKPTALFELQYQYLYLFLLAICEEAVHLAVTFFDKT